MVDDDTGKLEFKSNNGELEFSKYDFSCISKFNEKM